MIQGSRWASRPARRAAVAAIVALAFAVPLYHLPDVMAALYIFPPMPERVDRYLVFPADGQYKGNDDAPDLVMYDVDVRDDTRPPGAIGLAWLRDPNTVYINASNIANLVVSSRAIYADEAFKIAKYNWKDDTNLFKAYFVYRQKLTVMLRNAAPSPQPLDTLAFKDAPQPTLILVDGVPFANYTYDGTSGVISCSQLPQKVSSRIDIWFVETRADPPVANAVADRTVIQRGDAVSFDGSLSKAVPPKGLKQWYWDFGDGYYGVGETTNHTYDLPEIATYRVRLVVEDTDGLRNETSLFVDYNRGDIRPPVAEAGPNWKVNEDEMVTLDASGSSDNVGVVAYSWLTGDGAQLSGKVVSHTYLRNGSYSATLTVGDAAGNTATDSARVEVRNVAPLAAAGPDLSGALNQSLIFDASLSWDTPTDLATLDYFWEFGDGSYGYGRSTRHAYSAEGEYTVKLLVRDNDGAEGRDSSVVRVTDKPNLPPRIDPLGNVVVRMNYPWFLNVEPYVSDDNVSSLTLASSSLYSQPDPTPESRLRLRLLYTDPALTKETVRITVDDGQYDATGTLNVTVVKDTWPPEVVKAPAPQQFDEDTVLREAFDVRAIFSDRDNETLTYATVSQNVDASIGGGLVTLSARRDWFGIETVGIRAMDPKGAWAEAYFKVLVRPVNDAPTVVQEPLDANVLVGKSYSIALPAVFADVDDETLGYSSSGADVKIIGNGTGAVATWTPKQKDDSVEFTLTASDAGGLQNTTRKVKLVAIEQGLDPLAVALVALLAIVAAAGIGLAYRSYRWRFRVHEVFVVTEAGLLASHISSSESKAVHEELVAAMLTAIRKFVQESFGDEKEADRGLGRLDYEGFVIAVEQGKGFFVATVITGADSPPLRQKMRVAIDRVTEKWGKVLEDWDGDEARLAGLEEVVREVFVLPKLVYLPGRAGGSEAGESEASGEGEDEDEDEDDKDAGRREEADEEENAGRGDGEPAAPVDGAGDAGESSDQQGEKARDET